MWSWRDDLPERCITSKDEYNSYHYECIEKQICHTLNKLFVVGHKHKDLASPIQPNKWKSFIILLGKELYISYLYQTKWHKLNIVCTMKCWRDDLLERCITSKDGYNSYHCECIEKQTCHTLNKLFIVGSKHKHLASPIQPDKWKSFIVLLGKELYVSYLY